MKEAGLVEIKNHFEMSSTEFMTEWKSFSAEEKQWWKEEVGKLLYPEENE